MYQAMKKRGRKIALFLPFCLSITFFLFAVSRSKNWLHSMIIVAHDEHNCGCPRFGAALKYGQNMSLCSDWSTARGSGQRVIAYTIYGNANNVKVKENYYDQIENRIKEANFYYEDWIVRLYYDGSSTQNTYAAKLICKLFCTYPNFDPCPINNIFIPEEWTHLISSESLRNGNNPQVRRRDEKSFTDTINFKIMDFITSMMNPVELETGTIHRNVTASASRSQGSGEPTRRSFGEILIAKLWRFLPLGDDYVQEFLVRDVDSYILPREVFAVRQWLDNSTALIHAMRDHPSHNGVILAGLWGAARWRDKEKVTGFLKKIIRYPPRKIWNYDQILLKMVIWPQVQQQILVHDSYHCQNQYLRSAHRPLPFPSKRKGNIFVSWGPNRSPTEIRSIVPCPVECRPKEHIDWVFC